METTSVKHLHGPQAPMILREMGNIPSYLFTLLEIQVGKSQYAPTSDALTLICSREVEYTFMKSNKMKNDILFTINYFVLLQGKNVKDDVSKWNQRRVLLHVLLLSKELISGSSRESDDEDR